MAKLNQIVAVCNGVKSRTQSGVTGVYHKLQRKEMFQGISRTYRSLDEEGEKLPPESKKVQATVKGLLEEAQEWWVSLFDTVYTQDVANCQAKADIKVNGRVILASVPVTHLLFLEKKLVDVATFISDIPTLDPAYEWHYSSEADCYATEATETHRTKKVPRNHVKYEATKEHPAQVDLYTEDVIVGYWSKVDFSGAIPVAQKNAMVHRLSLLQDAVKQAREEANNIEVEQQSNADKLFNFLFSTTSSSD